MGSFSWVDVDCSKNIAYKDKVILLIPDEHKKAVAEMFGIEIKGNGIVGKYDGYGRVVDKDDNGVDVYDVMSFINICLTTDAQFKDALSQIRNSFKNFITAKDTTTQDIVKKLRWAYQTDRASTIERLRAWVWNEAGEGSKFFDLRTIGIDMMCYDRNNARVPYPIKWTTSKENTYENSEYSSSDSLQGCNKVRATNKSRSVQRYFERLNDEREKILAEVRAEREQTNQEITDNDLDRDDDGLGLD